MCAKAAFLGRGFCAESSGLPNPCLLLADETDDTQVTGVGEVMVLASPDVWKENNRMKYRYA